MIDGKEEIDLDQVQIGSGLEGKMNERIGVVTAEKITERGLNSQIRRMGG